MMQAPETGAVICRIAFPVSRSETTVELRIADLMRLRIKIFILTAYIFQLIEP